MLASDPSSILSPKQKHSIENLAMENILQPHSFTKDVKAILQSQGK
jgi:hypothetical protein